MTWEEFAILMVISIACTVALWYAVVATGREVDRWRRYDDYSVGVLAVTTILTLLPWVAGLGLLLLDFWVARTIL